MIREVLIMSKTRYKIKTTITQSFGDGFDNVDIQVKFVTGSKAKNDYIKSQRSGAHANYCMIEHEVTPLVAKGGYVYILENECMNGIYKIGRTARKVDARMDELFTSGLPTPFKLVFSAYVSDSIFVEKQLHKVFAKQRINKDREFFKVSPKAVIGEINKMVY
jgi:hypothetical protein